MSRGWQRVRGKRVWKAPGEVREGRGRREKRVGVAVTRSQAQDKVEGTQVTGTGTGGQKSPARPQEDEGNAGPGSAVTR